MSEAQTVNYDGVIPTGWLTAYGRTFADIPYSKEMFAALEEIRATGDSRETLTIMKDTNLAPQFEARHLMLNKYIAATGIQQVLEVAAGLSTRGIELTADPEMTYVELDLVGMVADKKKILGDLQAAGRIPDRPNLFIESGSATSSEDLLRATGHFKTAKPIIIANEGLLRYLGMDAKQQYADNVKALLKKFDGAWITSDISLPSIMYKENDVMVERRKRISAITGINVANNLFKDEADAKQFFTDLGFTVESHSFLEVIDELTSPGRLGMPRDYVEAINASPVVFVMRLKKSNL